MKILKIIIAIVSGLRLVGSAEASPPELGRMLVNSENAESFGVSWKCLAAAWKRDLPPDASAPLALEVDFYEEVHTGRVDLRGFDGRVVTVEMEDVRSQVVNVDV